MENLISIPVSGLLVSVRRRKAPVAWSYAWEQAVRSLDGSGWAWG
jgi:hypothetical protein